MIRIFYVILIIGIVILFNVVLSGGSKHLFTDDIDNLKFSQLYIMGTNDNNFPDIQAKHHGVYLADFDIKNDDLQKLKSFSLFYLKWAYERQEFVDYLTIYNRENIDPADTDERNKIIAKVDFRCKDGLRAINSLIIYPKRNNYNPKWLEGIYEVTSIPCETLN